MQVRLIALHGFLGGPGDWAALRPVMPWAVLEAVDLWPIAGGPLEGHSWEAIGPVLEREFRERARHEPLLPTVVLGYSFGARLTLSVEALARGDLPVAGVCLVSCHPGLADDDLQARAERRAADEAWARRFESAPEDEITRTWDAQPVLAPPRTVEQDEAGGPASRHAGSRPLPASRPALWTAMRRFSLAGQPDFSARLARWRTPLLWVTGEEDWKFDDLAGWLRQGGARAQFASCPRAGHRVPWDNPPEFAAILQRWLGGVPGIGRRGTVS
jgi:2-succinyl-6-hydroxy-2,4-cyclohexadiene-1-carboxylate synthase